MASPPQLLSSLSENNQTPDSNLSVLNINPSVLIVVIILSSTVTLTVSLCFLLRRCRRGAVSRQSDNVSFTFPLPSSSSRVSPRSADVSVPLPSSSVVETLPLFTFSAVNRADGGDCAVCLSKFEPEDRLRLLPLCCHAFHDECIGAWLATNESCPICRAGIRLSKSDIEKILAGDAGSSSFRLEIGSVNRRQQESGEANRSYSIGSFDYIVDNEFEIAVNETSRRNAAEKEECVLPPVPEPERNLAAEVGGEGSWLKDYMDRLSASFRSSGRSFAGSFRRNEVDGVGEIDLEGNGIGEEISELFRWFSFSGV